MWGSLYGRPHLGRLSDGPERGPAQHRFRVWCLEQRTCWWHAGNNGHVHARFFLVTHILPGKAATRHATFKKKSWACEQNCVKRGSQKQRATHCLIRQAKSSWKYPSDGSVNPAAWLEHGTRMIAASMPNVSLSISGMTRRPASAFVITSLSNCSITL